MAAERTNVLVRKGLNRPAESRESAPATLRNRAQAQFEASLPSQSRPMTCTTQPGLELILQVRLRGLGGRTRADSYSAPESIRMRELVKVARLILHRSNPSASGHRPAREELRTSAWFSTPASSRLPRPQSEIAPGMAGKEDAILQHALVLESESAERVGGLRSREGSTPGEGSTSLVGVE
jgi:hypothetical protein